MPTLDAASTELSFEQLLHGGEEFRDRIEIEIERAIAGVDPTSPRADRLFV